MGYGVFVWAGLLATVELPARGEEMLFYVNPVNFSLSLLGHLVYGGVLGLYLRHYIRRGWHADAPDTVTNFKLPAQRCGQRDVLDQRSGSPTISHGDLWIADHRS
jgi:hypothetical protein